MTALQHYRSIASLDTDARSDTLTQPPNDKRRRKARLVELLFAAGCSEEAKHVANCNRDYFALTCSNGHCAQILPTYRCRFRLCPYCATERQRRALLKLWPLLSFYALNHRMERLVLVTLTLETSVESLRNRDAHFKTAFRRLRRMKNWRQLIAGGVCCYEFTLTPTGWHYHAHILCFRKSWYDQVALAEDWQEATRGEGTIADIRSVSDLSNGLRDLLQYCFKVPDLEYWTTDEVKQFLCMSRLKLSECFGTLRGLKMNGTSKVRDDVIGTSARLFVGCPCPECGEPLKRIKVSWKEFEKHRTTATDWFGRARAGP